MLYAHLEIAKARRSFLEFEIARSVAFTSCVKKHVNYMCPLILSNFFKNYFD